jgi:hypothetical protein
MACDALTTGRDKACFNQIAGIKNVYFSTDALGAITYDVTNTDTITTFAGAPEFFKYEMRGTNNTFNSGSINKDLNNGTVYFSQELTVNFGKLDKATHKEIKLLVWASPTVIVETYNGDYFVMGLLNGADVTGGTIPTGGAKSDFSGYSLTMTAEEITPANFLFVDIPTTTATISATQIAP